ncbi:MAG: RAD55 family ATPase [Methanomicrobiales archaeon]
MVRPRYTITMAYESGFDRVPDNSVILIEEAPGVVKEIFTQKMAFDRAKEGKKVVYLTTRMKEDVISQMALFRITIPENFRIIDHFRTAGDLSNIDHGDFCVIDAFSTLCTRSDIAELELIMDWFLVESRKGSVFLLLSDSGVFNSREENLLRAMADGIIQFMSNPEGDKIKRAISIPKMKGTIPPDRMLPITINDEGILIDTRERHG